MSATSAAQLEGNTDAVAAAANELLARADTSYVQPSIIASALAGLGRFDDAFAWFERGARERDLLPVLNYFPASHAAKLDSRWPALMRSIGLEPAPQTR
jgi:hypothetical protein